MPGRALVTITLALVAGFTTLFLYAKPVTSLPSGFDDDLVVSVPYPTALAFAPDGRMLVTGKAGQLSVHEDGRTILALDLADPDGDRNQDDSKVCSNSERGLLGVAVDPRFGTPNNNFVYLYYTYKKHGVCPEKQPAREDNPVNRVSRFEMTGDTITGSEDVLIDNIPSPNGNHNGGDLNFGKDGKLYVSVGDGGCDYLKPGRCQYENAASRYGNVLLGKILRINPDGTIPAGNPFTGASSEPCGVDGGDGHTEPGKVCRETFARGFRNPFRMAFDPDAAKTAFYVNDVGGKSWEEIDRGRAGADYGWNLCEGRHDNPYRRGRVHCSGPNFTGPIHEYNHKKTGCESITGGAFVPDGAAWPSRYRDAYLFGDFVCGRIFSLTRKPKGGYSRQLFTRVLRPGAIALAFGPNEGGGQALYYTTFAGKQNGQVRRIAPAAGG